MMTAFEFALAAPLLSLARLSHMTWPPVLDLERKGPHSSRRKLRAFRIDGELGLISFRVPVFSQ